MLRMRKLSAALERPNRRPLEFSERVIRQVSTGEITPASFAAVVVAFALFVWMAA